ncbi:MAG TPA: hypothetical protein VMF61_05490 [Candidatus Acidoferrales bacterium]|nr:hypothetical protein [Candidatus Acidoferrales bacterium]
MKHRTTLALLVALVATAPGRAAAQTAVPSPSATPSPDEIFRQAFLRLESYPIPPFAVFTSVWKVMPTQADAQGAAGSYPWRYALRSADGLENAAEPGRDDLQLPKAAVVPSYTGLFATILRPVEASPAPGVSVPSPLKVIAVVAATHVAYDITLAGIERVGGYACYHLRLRPLEEQRRYTLRDLWVDTQTADLRQASFIIEGRADHENWDGARETVTFAPALQYWIVAREQWAAGGPMGGHTFDVQTERVAFPPELPDWIFDQHAYDAHRRAGEKDPLAEILDAVHPPGPAR